MTESGERRGAEQLDVARSPATISSRSRPKKRKEVQKQERRDHVVNSEAIQVSGVNKIKKRSSCLREVSIEVVLTFSLTPFFSEVDSSASHVRIM